jgi:hypothetical protein
MLMIGHDMTFSSALSPDPTIRHRARQLLPSMESIDPFP